MFFHDDLEGIPELTALVDDFEGVPELVALVDDLTGIAETVALVDEDIDRCHGEAHVMNAPLLLQESFLYRAQVMNDTEVVSALLEHMRALGVPYEQWV